MEPSIFSRLWAFIKAACTKYIKPALTGAGFVGCSVYPLFFNPIPPELLHTWIGKWAWMKTIVSAYLGSLAAALGTHHVEIIKNKRNERNKKQKGNGRKAA